MCTVTRMSGGDRGAKAAGCVRCAHCAWRSAILFCPGGESRGTVSLRPQLIDSADEKLGPSPSSRSFNLLGADYSYSNHPPASYYLLFIIYYLIIYFAISLFRLHLQELRYGPVLYTKKHRASSFRVIYEMADWMAVIGALSGHMNWFANTGFSPLENGIVK